VGVAPREFGDRALQDVRRLVEVIRDSGAMMGGQADVEKDSDAEKAKGGLQPT
jgi:hypothetical protein